MLLRRSCDPRSPHSHATPRASKVKTRVRNKWQSEGAAAHYSAERFRNDRARGRDPHLVKKLLDRHLAGCQIGATLDVPCGTGRLAPLLSSLSGFYTGADVSAAMLSEAREPLVRADAERLPFRARSFEVVVCCRLLHHLDEGRELAAVIRELTRVSSELVIASFWDAASLPALRRRCGLRREQTGRRPVTRARLEQCFEEAGAEVLGYASSFRYLSMQCFAAARVRS